jgi:serine protease Do
MRSWFARLLAGCLIAGSLLAAGGAGGGGLARAQGVSRETQRDFEVVNGYYFTQAGGSSRAELGYTITDEEGIPFWTEYQRLGGPDLLGYPVSRRFLWDGLVVQAMQKVILQWRPDTGQVVFVNLLDEMTRAGKDDWLTAERLIPRPDAFPQEAGLTFDQVTQQRFHLLDAYPALRAAYLASPDPLAVNGLPVAPVADVGPALVLRAQRRAFQLWKVQTPFARPGEVTVVNGGDLGKEAGLYPQASIQPEPARDQIAAPPGSNTRLSADEVAALRHVVQQARPAVVKLMDNDQGYGTGILFDPSGLILTNSHVVTSLTASRLQATFQDGRSVPAKVVGFDDWTDVAVVKVDATGLPTVPLGTSQSLKVGQRVIGIGYAPVLPGAPSAKTGTVRSLAGEVQTQHDYPLFNLIASTTYLHPGDSGGPLLNLSGQVVGVNSAIRVARRGQELTGFSIPVEGARSIADQIITTGGVSRPHLGVTVADVTPALATQLGLPLTRGVLVRDVTPGSPAALAGIQGGDVIVGMDGREVFSLDDLRRYIVNHGVGDVVPFAVITPGSPRRTVNVTLAERPVVKLILSGDSPSQPSLV